MLGHRAAQQRTILRASNQRLGFEQCEARLMMHGGDVTGSNMGAGFETAYFSTINWAGIDGTVGQFPEEFYDPGQTDSERDDFMGLPKLNSLPGAAATIYLDFNGNFEADWWFGNGGPGTHHKNVSTPVFDTDNNPLNFSTTEQNQIKEIWARVAEDYAPFNINVSTAYYGGFENLQALHVVMGGNNQDWLKQDTSGIASINSFSQAAPNVVFVFDLMEWERNGVSDSEGHTINGVAAMANTASHEAGHAFGLEHRSRYNVEGDMITEYDPGGAGWTPIMGNNKAADRTTWDAGPTPYGADTYQDDIALLARAANGFGLRADDHGNSIATANPLQPGLSVYQPQTGKGIINSMNDVDVFKFTTPGGNIRIDIRAATFGPNLIPIARLYSAGGFVANASGGNLTQSIINVSLSAGTYFVMVSSFGDYGDMGQFTVSVTTTLEASQKVLPPPIVVEPSPIKGRVTKTTASRESTRLASANDLKAGQAAAEVPPSTNVFDNSIATAKSSAKTVKPTRYHDLATLDAAFALLGLGKLEF